MDLSTILRAIDLVGETSPAGTQLFEGFIPLTTGRDQEALKERYAAVQKRPGQQHTRMLGEFER